ncbi:MAG: metalloregulator ArsR/SmtB family transcription factor [Pseudomonadota bacterium]
MTQTDALTPVFAALADPHRRQILDWLRISPATVGDLTVRLPLSQPGVTKHLGVLERAGLIHRRAEGRTRVCELSDRGFRAAEEWMSGHRRFWDSALDKLADLAEEPVVDD